MVTFLWRLGSSEAIDDTLGDLMVRALYNRKEIRSPVRGY